MIAEVIEIKSLYSNVTAISNNKDNKKLNFFLNEERQYR